MVVTPKIIISSIQEIIIMELWETAKICPEIISQGHLIIATIIRL